MPVNDPFLRSKCVSYDTSGAEADGRTVRAEANEKMGRLGDPLMILINLETIATNRLRYTRDLVTDDQKYISEFIDRHI